MRLFIAVAGNMGVGKSTLTEKLAEALGGQPFYEPANENPYLADFYGDMDRWGFHSQMFYLARRLEDHASIINGEGILIQDRSLYENAEVFARNLFEQGRINQRDWDVYKSVYETASHLLRPPDLVIYLQATVPSLIERIQKRGRTFEQNIDPKYLEDLNRLYDSWIDRFIQAPVLKVSTEEVRYLEEPEQFQHVLSLVKQRLGGLPTSLF